MRSATFLTLLALLVPGAASAAPAARVPAASLRVAVHGPGASALARGLTAAGYRSQVLADAAPALDRARTDVLVMADAARFPIGARDALLAFLKSGGHMVVVGGPLFSKSVTEEEARWLAALRAVPPSKLVCDFASHDVSGWKRAGDGPGERTTWAIEDAGPKEAPRALRFDIGEVRNWDTLGGDLPDRFADGADLVTFWARGDANTPAMTLELQERDGSRWIAIVPLATTWSRHTLAREDFVYWPDSSARGRGGPADRVILAQAARMQVGLAQSHISVGPGRHVFWVAAVGSASLPDTLRKPDLTLPVLELFSPHYKYYRLPSLRPTAAELEAAAATGHQDGPVVSPIPRPRGLATAGTARARWIPLDSITDALGRRRGSRRSLLVNIEPPYRGSVWGQIAAPPPVSKVAPGRAPSKGLVADVVDLLRRIRGGVFVTRAGAEGFSYFTDEEAPFGCRVLNVASVPRRVDIEARVADPSGKVSARRGTSVVVGPGKSAEVSGRWRPLAAGVWSVTGAARLSGEPQDLLTQEITALAPPGAPGSAFVKVRQGDFWRPPVGASGAKPTKWYPYGVNYWQSNVAGAEPQDYSLHWLAPAYYDPQIVERDLTTLHDLGCTSVSIALADPAHTRQANDFIARAARHGVLTNLYIGGAHPFATNEALFTRLITEGRFAGNPSVWAFDIAWEHHLGLHAERRGWDREWEAWVLERYGTIEHAEANWGVPIPRGPDGRVTNPPDEQLRTDGPWLRLAAAYARCADDVINDRYRSVIRRIRSLAPHQLISARSASQPSWTSWFAYDLVSCGKQFDFSSPEGYGLDPAEAGLTTAYARYAASGKPVFWAEFGASLYPYDASGRKAAKQAELHRGFARMLTQSGANGLASWWSVGGYRVDERSDFGIIAPDGTPRRAARELQEAARAATSPREAPRIGSWVTVDRDLHAAAYQAVYEAHKGAYVTAASGGSMVGVRTEATGSTSANCPLTAVGNVPYDGFNPPKYLNAEFVRLYLVDAAGRRRDVADGDTVDVPAGKPVQCGGLIGNLGDALWLGGDAVGSVRLVGDDRPDAYARGVRRLTFSAPLASDTARHEDVAAPIFELTPGINEPCVVVITLEAKGRARFGPRVRLRLRPV